MKYLVQFNVLYSGHAYEWLSLVLHTARRIVSSLTYLLSYNTRDPQFSTRLVHKNTIPQETSFALNWKK